MTRSLCIIDGHPDPAPEHFIHALADAYSEGAIEAGHRVERITIAALTVAPLRRSEAFDHPPEEPVLSEREKIRRADHVMLAFPLWLGSMPAATRAFFEQAASGGFFLQAADTDQQWPMKRMQGKSARIIVTMGMPGFAYRSLMGSGSLKALERGLFGLSGFKPVRHTILGGVDAASDAKRRDWLTDVRSLGRSAR